MEELEKSGLVRGLNFVGEKSLGIMKVVLLSAVVLGIPLAFLAGRKVERDTYVPSTMEVRKTGRGAVVYIDDRAQPQLFYDANASDPNKVIFTDNPEFFKKLRNYDANQLER